MITTDETTGQDLHQLLTAEEEKMSRCSVRIWDPAVFAEYYAAYSRSLKIREQLALRLLEKADLESCRMPQPDKPYPPKLDRA